MKRILNIILLLCLIVSSPISVHAQESSLKFDQPTNEMEDIKDGLYSIGVDGEYMSVEDGSIVMQEEQTEWALKSCGENTVAIISMRTGYCLSTNNFKKASSARLKASGFEGEDNQLWMLKKNKKGKYQLVLASKQEYALGIKDEKLQIVSSKKGEAFEFTYIRSIMEEEELNGSIEDIEVAKTSNEKGNISVFIESPECEGIVSCAMLTITPKNNLELSKTMYVPVNDKGNIEYLVRARDFEYESGEYTIDCELLLEGVYVSQIDTFTCQVEDALENLKKNIIDYINLACPGYEDWQLYLRDVKSNRELDVNSDKQQAASMIKMFVAGAAFDEYDRLCEAYKKDFIDRNLNNVIVVSDNKAWMTLVECLGDGDYDKGYEKVTKWANENGYKDVESKNIDSYNFCSTKDTTQFFLDQYNGKYKYSKRMLGYFHNQAFRHKIPAGVPSDVKTGNKTGDLFTTENDTAIIYAPQGTYILSVMSTGLADIYQARNTIRYLSNMVYTFLNE